MSGCSRVTSGTALSSTLARCEASQDSQQENRRFTLADATKLMKFQHLLEKREQTRTLLTKTQQWHFGAVVPGVFL